MVGKYEPISASDLKKFTALAGRLEDLRRTKCYIDIELTLLNMVMNGNLSSESRLRVPVDTIKKEYIDDFAKLYDDHGVKIKYLETIEEDVEGKRMKLYVYSCVQE
jgi:hypothetical protein